MTGLGGDYGGSTDSSMALPDPWCCGFECHPTEGGQRKLRPLAAVVGGVARNGVFLGVMVTALLCGCGSDASVAPATATGAAAPTAPEATAMATPPLPAHVVITPTGVRCGLGLGTAWSCSAATGGASWHCSLGYGWRCFGSDGSGRTLSWSCGTRDNLHWACTGSGTGDAHWGCSSRYGVGSWQCSADVANFSCGSRDGGFTWSCDEIAGYPDLTWQPFMQPS